MVTCHATIGKNLSVKNMNEYYFLYLYMLLEADRQQLRHIRRLLPTIFKY